MCTNILFSEETTKHAFKNYYHLFSDILRPLYNYMSIHNLTELDIQIYFRCGPTDFAKGKLEELGFNIKPIEELSGNYIEISKNTHNDISYLFIKCNTFIEPINKEKIILIKRTNRRILLNHTELFESLRQNFNHLYDIEEVSFDNKTLKEQINIMRDCKILIGPHGAGFTNIFFLNENTHTIEFFPESFYVDCFKKLFRLKNIKFYYLHGKDITTPPIRLEEFISLEKEGKMWNPTNPYVSQLRDIKGFSINIDEVLNIIKTIA
jgi:hypothetical protein